MKSFLWSAAFLAATAAALPQQAGSSNSALVNKAQSTPGPSATAVDFTTEKGSGNVGLQEGNNGDSKSSSSTDSSDGSLQTKGPNAVDFTTHNGSGNVGLDDENKDDPQSNSNTFSSASSQQTKGPDTVDLTTDKNGANNVQQGNPLGDQSSSTTSTDGSLPTGKTDLKNDNDEDNTGSSTESAGTSTETLTNFNNVLTFGGNKNGINTQTNDNSQSGSATADSSFTVQTGAATTGDSSTPESTSSSNFKNLNSDGFPGFPPNGNGNGKGNWGPWHSEGKDPLAGLNFPNSNDEQKEEFERIAHGSILPPPPPGLGPAAELDLQLSGFLESSESLFWGALAGNISAGVDRFKIDDPKERQNVLNNIITFEAQSAVRTFSANGILAANNLTTTIACPPGVGTVPQPASKEEAFALAQAFVDVDAGWLGTIGQLLGEDGKDFPVIPVGAGVSDSRAQVGAFIREQRQLNLSSQPFMTGASPDYGFHFIGQNFKKGDCPAVDLLSQKVNVFGGLEVSNPPKSGEAPQDTTLNFKSTFLNNTGLQMLKDNKLYLTYISGQGPPVSVPIQHVQYGGNAGNYGYYDGEGYSGDNDRIGTGPIPLDNGSGFSGSENTTNINDNTATSASASSSSSSSATLSINPSATPSTPLTNAVEGDGNNKRAIPAAINDDNKKGNNNKGNGNSKTGTGNGNDDDSLTFTFQASFPGKTNFFDGLTLAAITVGKGPFINVLDVSAVTVNGPVAIETD